MPFIILMMTALHLLAVYLPGGDGAGGDDQDSHYHEDDRLHVRLSNLVVDEG